MINATGERDNLKIHFVAIKFTFALIKRVLYFITLIKLFGLVGTRDTRCTRFDFFSRKSNVLFKISCINTLGLNLSIGSVFSY